ncbi:MAG: hypothetical protein F4086_17655 [Gemmatimonadetes bacterium]|nr:hypothetical protein [Gemmatimonadota bacterium]MYJ12132.1 hypothetical protein [Gemmatimonadota bacterium]
MSIADKRLSRTAADSYRDLMEQVKKRTEAVSFFMRMHGMYAQVVAESVALQLRNILETIVLGSLVSDLPEYEKRRADIRKTKRMSLLMKTMDSVNKDYYPVPTRQVLDAFGRVTETVPVESGFLTKDECPRLYGKCGNMLHTLGPAADPFSFLDEAPEWLNKIIALLNHHQIQLSNPDIQLWTLMNASSDSRVHVYTFERVREKDVRFLPRDAQARFERLSEDSKL